MNPSETAQQRLARSRAQVLQWLDQDQTRRDAFAHTGLGQLTALPWVEARTGLEITQWLDLSHLFELVRSNWERAGGVATTLLGYLSRSGFALLTLVANVALLPVLFTATLCGAGVWLVLLLAGLTAYRDISEVRFDITAADNLRARRRRTRIGILHRIGVTRAS